MGDVQLSDVTAAVGASVHEYMEHESGGFDQDAASLARQLRYLACLDPREAMELSSAEDVLGRLMNVFRDVAHWLLVLSSAITLGPSLSGQQGAGADSGPAGRTGTRGAARTTARDPSDCAGSLPSAERQLVHDLSGHRERHPARGSHQRRVRALAEG
jgi:hypothetical protein